MQWYVNCKGFICKLHLTCFVTNIAEAAGRDADRSPQRICDSQLYFCSSGSPGNKVEIHAVTSNSCSYCSGLLSLSHLTCCWLVPKSWNIINLVCLKLQLANWFWLLIIILPILIYWYQYCHELPLILLSGPPFPVPTPGLTPIRPIAYWHREEKSP